MNTSFAWADVERVTHGREITHSRDQDHPLDLFHVRCCTLADRVVAGGIGFIDAVDLAYTAAQFSGLADRVGDDAVQAVMASAFMGCHS